MRATRLLSVLAALADAHAAHQQLPHEVLNVSINTTQPAVTTAQAGVSYLTITALITTTAISTATETSTVVETLTTTETTTETTSIIPTPSPTPPITYATITPSPSAHPIYITEQSQVITTYYSEAIWCVDAPIHYSSISGGPFTNGSANYTAITAGTGSCSTLYSAAPTTMCSTTLTGLVNKITVSFCDQEISFSTDSGYSLLAQPATTYTTSLVSGAPAATLTTTPFPSLQRLVTYWLAPWTALTDGAVPSSVDVKICTLDAPRAGSRTCQRYREVWEIVLVTATVTIPRTVEFVTTLSGPGTLQFPTTQSVINQEVVTVDLSTTMLLETEIEVESTSVSVVQERPSISALSSTPIFVPSPSSRLGPPSQTRRSTSTRYITRHLALRPSSVLSVSSVLALPSAVSGEEGTSTTWQTQTKMVTQTGTVTMRRGRVSSSSMGVLQWG